MRILAMETSGLSGSVAALDDDRLLLEIDLNPHQRSAQSLAPAMESLMGQVDWMPRDVDLVAVTRGPGSFTGLRVGVTTAKTFAYAVGAEIVGINTLEAIAWRAPKGTERLAVAVDAHRGEVVAQSFLRGATGRLDPVDEPALIAVDAWLANLPRGTVLSGPVFRKLEGRIPPGLILADPDCWQPRAAAVAHLAARQHATGRHDDPWKLSPHYYRQSAAEEKANARRESALKI